MGYTGPKYSMVALPAAEAASKGMHPLDAWEHAVAIIFPDSVSSRLKACPKSTFLGLAEAGLLYGIPPGKYTKSEANKRYAIAALKLIQSNSAFAQTPKTLWARVMELEGAQKVHNHQMEVVTVLWLANKFALQAPHINSETA